MTYALIFDFQVSNNELEYEALITGLQLAIKMGCEQIHASTGLMVVANQTNGLYEIQGRNLEEYVEKVSTLTKHFKSFRLEHVPTSKNKRADAFASSTFPYLTNKVLVEIVQVKAIKEKPIMSVIAKIGD